MNKKTAAIIMTMAMVNVPVGGVLAQETADITAQQLFVDAMSYAIEAPGMTGTMQFEGEGSLKVSGEGSPETSVGMSASGKLDFSKAAEPFGMQMNGNINVGFLGQSMNMGFELYTVESEDGKTLNTYSRGISMGTESPWEFADEDYEGIWDAMDVSGPEEFKEKMNEALDEVKLQIAWDIEEQENAYGLYGQFSYADLLPFIEEAEDESDMTQEDMAMAEDILQYVKVSIDCTFDKETHALLKADVSLDDSDMEGFSEKLTELLAKEMEGSGSTSQTQIGIVLSTCGFSAEFNYDSVPQITVPEEAVKSAVSEKSAVSGNEAE